MFRIKTTIQTATGTTYSERVEPEHRIQAAKQANASKAQMGDTVTHQVTKA